MEDLDPLPYEQRDEHLSTDEHQTNIETNTVIKDELIGVVSDSGEIKSIENDT